MAPGFTAGWGNTGDNRQKPGTNPQLKFSPKHPSPIADTSRPPPPGTRFCNGFPTACI
jgi:hypothetical protein